MDGNSRIKAFSAVYAQGGWGNQGSGPGSQPDQAGPFLATLSKLVDELKPNTILDIGCGQALALEALEDFHGIYAGIDLVESVIEANRLKYPESEFFVHDLVICPVNRRFDLAICKDVLQHLSFASALALMENASECCRHALIINDFHSINAVVGNILDGGYRTIPDLSEFSHLFSRLEWLGDYSVVSNEFELDIKSMHLATFAKPA